MYIAIRSKANTLAEADQPFLVFETFVFRSLYFCLHKVQPETEKKEGSVPLSRWVFKQLT